MTYTSFVTPSETVTILGTEITIVGEYGYLGVNDNGDVVVFDNDSGGIEFHLKHGEWLSKNYLDSGTVIGQFDLLPPEYESGKVYMDLYFLEGVSTFPIIED